MNNPKIETDIAEILLEIKSDIKELKNDMATVKTDVAVIKNNQDNIKEQLSGVSGTQKAQIWSLILAVIGASVTLAVALFRKTLV